MKRITLLVVAVLLAAPVAAQAKAGIEFDQDITTSKPGEQQGFTVIAHGGGGSGGARPLVTFHSESSGKVIRVRATPLGPQGTSRASVTFPDHGPWTASMSINGKSFGDELHGQTFEVGPPRSVRVVGTMEPPADPPPADDGGFPMWILTIPAALLAALGILYLAPPAEGARRVKRFALALALLLVLPAGASAKGGVIFEKYPDVQALGAPMKFTVMLFNRRDVRPLVTFRDSKTGAVVRTRASRSDLNGIAYGTVALPSHGPWTTTVSVNARPVFEGDAEPFRVGVGLTQTIPSADAERAPAAESIWPWIAAAAAASVAAAFALHRRRRWGAA